MDRVFQHGHTTNGNRGWAEAGRRKVDWRRWAARLGWFEREASGSPKHWAQIHALEVRQTPRPCPRRRLEGWRKAVMKRLFPSPPTRHWAQIHAVDEERHSWSSPARAIRFCRWWQAIGERLRVWQKRVVALAFKNKDG